MTPSDYGPVPISRLKAESGAVFDALAGGRRVLIARRDRVVALIDPVVALPAELVAAYATPGGRRLAELTAAAINHGSPSRAVAQAAAAPCYVTKGRLVYGLLRAVTDTELAGALPSPEQIAERERRTEEFLATTPEPGAEALARLGETLNAELGITRDPSGPGR